MAQELYESDLVLGNPLTVAAFVREACERLGANLVAARQGATAVAGTWRLPYAALPLPIRERTATAFVHGTAPPAEVLITFEPPARENVHVVGRTHPLVEGLAEFLLDEALDPPGPGPRASRCGAIRTASVTRRTTLLLLRLRLQIEGSGQETPLLAEELIVAAFEGRPGSLRWLDDDAARRLLEAAQPAGNLTLEDRQAD